MNIPMLRLVPILAVLGAALVLTAVHAQTPPPAAPTPDPVACITVARDIHEYEILFRSQERDGWPNRKRETLARMAPLWASFEHSEAHQYRDDLDAWDSYWVRCYEETLKALMRPLVVE